IDAKVAAIEATNPPPDGPRGPSRHTPKIPAKVPAAELVERQKKRPYRVERVHQTIRDEKVLSLILQGYTYPEIAQTMGYAETLSITACIQRSLDRRAPTQDQVDYFRKLEAAKLDAREKRAHARHEEYREVLSLGIEHADRDTLKVSLMSDAALSSELHRI